MRVEEFNFPSADHQTEIHTYRWIPDGEVKGILQITHGMVEHISRYEEFARFLTERGILVTGHDQLGHGRSITSEEELWHFPNNGNVILLKDIHTLRMMTRKKYPEAPYFLLGHSMGSYLVRQYLCYEGAGLAGSIIVGTGNEPAVKLAFASLFAGIYGKTRGKKHHSKLMNAMAFGSYQKRIKEKKTGFEWLSRDTEKVQEYIADPLCGGLFTIGAFQEFFHCMRFLKKKDNRNHMPNDLPILLTAGEEDPVGNYGKGVRGVGKELVKQGLEDVSLKLYPEDRHEILNELDRVQVYRDIADWIMLHIS